MKKVIRCVAILYLAGCVSGNFVGYANAGGYFSKASAEPEDVTPKIAGRFNPNSYYYESQIKGNPHYHRESCDLNPLYEYDEKALIGGYFSKPTDLVKLHRETMSREDAQKKWMEEQSAESVRFYEHFRECKFNCSTWGGKTSWAYDVISENGRTQRIGHEALAKFWSYDKRTSEQQKIINKLESLQGKIDEEDRRRVEKQREEDAKRAREATERARQEERIRAEPEPHMNGSSFHADLDNRLRSTTILSNWVSEHKDRSSSERDRVYSAQINTEGFDGYCLLTKAEALQLIADINSERLRIPCKPEIKHK